MTASAFWAIGLLVALALLWQAILRLSEEDRLALAHEHATQSAALAAGIDEALLALNRSDPTDGLRKLADLRPRPPMVL